MPVLRLACRVIGMGGRRRIGRLAGGSSGGVGRIVALGGAMLLAPQFASDALAACVLASGTYTCSGTTLTAVIYSSNNLAIVLDNTFQNTVAIASRAFDLTVPSSGDLSLTAQAGSSVWGSSVGIYAVNHGDGATTIDIAGSVEGTAVAGVDVQSSVSAQDVTFTQSAGSLIKGGNYGVSVYNVGSGTTTIDISGSVEATSGVGLYAFNGATAGGLTITEGAGGAIKGIANGINAISNASGALTIDISGSVEATSGAGINASADMGASSLTITEAAGGLIKGANGISASNSGLGATEIAIAGTVEATSGVGVSAANYSANSTDLTITEAAGGSIKGGSGGISTSNHGKGGTTINIAGAVESTSGMGINAYNGSRASYMTIIEAAGGSIKGQTGIYAFNHGQGALVIDVAGTVEATAGGAVNAYNDLPASDLTITEAAGGSIKGSGDGIHASNYGLGALLIDITGTVEGTNNDGVYAYNNDGASDLTITEAAGGSVKGGSYGISASNYGFGALTIGIAGTVEGTNYDGVYAYNNFSATDLTITETAGGSIKGASNGISASNYGMSALVFDIAGSVVATSGVGIYGFNASGAKDLLITEAASGSIIGSSYGISAENTGTGKTSISIAGDVTGTSQSGVYVVNGSSSKELTIAVLSGTITGGVAGLAAFDSSSYKSTISVAADSTISGGTNGLRVRSGSAGSEISVAGRISGGSASIYLDGGAGPNTLNLFNTAVLSGAVNFNSNTNGTINFHSGSYDVSVLGYNIATNTVNLLGKNQTLVTPGLSGVSTTGRLVVVDSAAATQVAGLTRDFAGAVLNVVGDVANAGGGIPTLPLGYAETARKPNPTDVQAGGNAAQVYDAYGNLVWIRGFGGARTQEADSSRLGLDSHHYGLVGGYDHWSEDWRIGVFAGGGQAFGTLSGDASSIRNDVGLAGLYARRTMGASWLETTVSGGYVGAETERRINGGAETATGSFNGGFAAVQVALATRYALGSNWSITPSVKNRYLAIFSESYTETGSSQNASYDAAVSQGLEQSVEAKVAYATTTADGLLVNYWLRGAAFAQEAVGDSRIDASVLGVGFATDAGDSDVVYGGTVGLGVDAMLSDRASVFLSVDGTLASNQVRSGAMRGGWKLAF